MTSLHRSTTVVVLALAALATAACSGGGGKPAEGDMALGAPEGAKVTVVEYASVTCHVCAAWQEEVWPAFKTKYVDTNKVRYVFREMPTPPVDVATAGFLLARCAGEDKYFDVVHEMLASVKQTDAGTPPRQVLLRVAGAVGVSEARMQECITDPEGVEALDARITAARAAGVTGTPTFLVNGAVVTDRSMSGLSEAIDAVTAK